jgi:hypothetical protein
MNRALIDDLLRGLDNERAQAALVPTEGACCVELRRRPALRNAAS